MAKYCLFCGNPTGIFTRVTIADGHLCDDCWQEAGIYESWSGDQYNSATIKEIIAVRKRNQATIDSFKATSNVGMISFDDNTQAFVVTSPLNQKNLYYYNQIVDFELLEDGETITKNGGLGRAVAGGLLFGGVGAIVGGVTSGKKSKNVCTSLQIKITLRNSPKQTEYLPFITFSTETNSSTYKAAYRSAQDALSALQLAVEKVSSPSVEAPIIQQAISGADEILKYKGLWDAGIITEEEFNAKKAQILGL